jgi:hypothetical protein
VRRFAPQLFAQVFCISLLLFSVYRSQAQKIQPASPQERIRNQQMSVDRLREQTPAQPFARDRTQVEADVRKDFRQLQIVNNTLMEGMFTVDPNQKITNKEIRSSLGEIKRLAERLRSNFGIPKLKAKAKPEVALVPGLQQLDKAVGSFVDNPLFQQSRVFDAELASKAGKDLSDVLRLAEVLRELTKEE